MTQTAKTNQLDPRAAQYVREYTGAVSWLVKDKTRASLMHFKRANAAHTLCGVRIPYSNSSLTAWYKIQSIDCERCNKALAQKAQG